MCEHVYRVGDLRKQVVDTLRAYAMPMSAELLALKLNLPLWAVEAGLVAAAVAQMADMVSVAPGDWRWVAKVATVAEVAA